ncbi:D-alanyl-D-alanine carboxypeptidase [Catalinimonas alkaloidigena]|uniref:D-alanyl-D-alanine carboxypeptidase n=1 Tax=Catalinimonas alkaloidigena TaxID=1075417 RepID=A0A1G9SAK5_9BACT|nr:serine hydrolase domain-containing protein [Catalinimonas alkaloidigena]SDM32357.1 D-alanyl-D-alanine carboxypeptidase [Catalinimonas alkaloidigena]
MKKSAYVPLLFALGIGACQELEVEAPALPCGTGYGTHPKHATYQAYLDTYRQETQAPGVVLLVARPDQPLWVGSSGQANLAHQAPFCTETPFRLGSITKVYVATLIMKLQEEGQLALDDPLHNVLPEVATRIPSAEKITVRHLLGHTSGLIDPPNQSLQYQADIVNDPTWFGNMSTTELLEKYVYGKALLFEPGTAYSYSNPGYWLLGKIAERVGQKPLADLLSEKIFTPLHLTHTYLEKHHNPDVSRGYAASTGSKVKDVTPWDEAEGDGKAAGGMISTAEDLYRFYDALFSGVLVSPASVEAMKTQQLPDCDGVDCEYGLGLEIWHLGNQTGYGHNGALIGIEANALYFPERNTMLVLYKNLGGGSDKSFLEDLL